MRITKKTRLLKRRVRIRSIAATLNAGTGYATVALRVDNPEGIQGYSGSGSMDDFNADLYVNGTKTGTERFVGTHGGVATADTLGCSVGDTVKVVLTVDPAKTEFDQEPVVAETSVTAP